MDKFSSDRPFVKEDKFLNVLAEAYKLQEAIISATELSIISVNPEGVITSFNKAAETMLGYTAEEVIGRYTPMIFHDLDEILIRAEELTHELGVQVTPGFDTFAIKARTRGTADRKEWTYIRKDGTHFPVIVSMSALRNDKGQLMGYASIASDITEQKRSDEKIKESESHLRALVASIDDIVFEIDEHGRYVNIWANDDSILFLPKKDIIGKSLSELYGEKFSQPFNDILREVLKTGKPHNQEYKSLVKGDERWFNAKYSLIKDDNTPTRRVSVCIQDITAKKKAEFALRESEEKFRLLADNIPGIIYLCNNDRNYSMIYINNKAEEVTGYSKEEFLNGEMHFSHLFHPEDAAYVYSNVDNAVAGRKSFHIKYRIRHRSGEWRWVEEYGIGVYSEQELLWIEGIISDITQAKAAEEELLRMADENYRVFNNTISLNAITGFDGYFKKLNPAWEKTLGWTIDELTEKPFIEFVHSDDIARTREMSETLQKGIDISFENRYRCKDGSYRWLLWTSSADTKREIIYASAIDITERKRTEEELLHSKHNVETVALKLQEQNRQLDEFAHILSHNLRSPLGNIQALISFLNERSTIDDYKLIFDKLKNVSKNLSETMNELMDTLKIKKSTNIERVELRFKDVLDKVVQSLEGDLIQCNASLTFDFNKAPKVSYSKTYLESIFQNVLSNALKYRSPTRAPEIHFESSIVGNQVELKVTDNGLGIDMERFGSKLFGLHKTFHEHEEAKGVGLFLTKTQIETLGGSITAESEVDKGTTFIMRFNQ